MALSLRHRRAIAASPLRTGGSVPYRGKDFLLSSHPSSLLTAEVTHKPPCSKLALISTEQFIPREKTPSTSKSHNLASLSPAGDNFPSGARQPAGSKAEQTSPLHQEIWEAAGLCTALCSQELKASPALAISPAYLGA